MARRSHLAALLTSQVLASAFNLAPAQLKDFANRVEGTQFHPNGLREYELLGFYAYRQDFPLLDGVNLRLRFFAPEQNELAFVEARELNVYYQYAMVPKDPSVEKLANGWREFKGWPVSAVLKPNGIGADNLGVIVRLKTNAQYQENIAPAILLEEHQSVPTAIAEYIIYLKFADTLKSLKYQVDGVSHYSKSYPYVNPKSPKDPSVEGETKIELKFPAQAIPAGPVTLHIGGPFANKTGPPLEVIYRFYHKPL